MTLATRMTLIVTLMFVLARTVAAQETTTTAPTTTAGAASTTAETATATTTTAEPTTTSDTASYEIRKRFTRLLREKSPPELAMILKLDPTLLSNETFLAGYPHLDHFLDANPEVRINPRFYLADFPMPGHSNRVFESLVEILAIFTGFGLGIFALGWIVRTIVEQKRWSRLARTQSDVHNKILDRFGSSDELLQYIKTPAGTKFLESAPIPVRAEAPPKNAPVTRIMWSVQLGVVIVMAGLGMLLVSLRFGAETGQELFAMGAIAFCVGAGFIASAAASIFLSRRLGLWKQVEEEP